MKQGRIILLNGVSSSGKTTLARTLVERLVEPYFFLSSDTFALMDTERIPAGMMSLEDKVLTVMHRTIKAFSDMGLNVIADHLFVENRNWLDECVTLLHEYPVLFVHVVCPIEELRRREKERGNRHIGQGESQLSKLVPQDMYDITIDTFVNTKEESADKIIESLDCNEKTSAFETLWSRRTV